MTDLNSIIARCKNRWLIGGSVLGDLRNSPLEPYMKVPESDELSVLALVSVTLKSCYLAKKPQKIEVNDLIPILRLPYLDGIPREHLKKTLLFFKTEKLNSSPILALLATRGYVVNPLDWMPYMNASVTLPAIYNPWLAWLDTGKQQTHVTDLTVDTWDDFHPSERIQILKEIRAVTPRKVLELIGQKALAENAEKRLKIMKVLEQNLGEYDADFLEQLATDRSQKVKQFATRLLIRLGKKKNPKESIMELVDFFAVKKRFLKTTIALKKIKTQAQARRREELMEQIALTELLYEWNISMEDFVKRYRFDDRDNQGNVSSINLLTSAIDDQDLLVAFAEKYLESGNVSVAGLEKLAKDLSKEKALQIAGKAIQKNYDEHITGIALAYSCLQKFPGTLSRDTIKSGKSYKRILQLAKKSTDSKSNEVSEYLNMLGFMADAKAAKKIVEDFIGNGVLAMDPYLSLLKLNASLDG